MSTDWYPYGNRYGLLTALAGSAWTAALALGIALPTELAAAIVIAELLPRPWQGGIRTILELSAAVPSVVYGLVGLWLLLPALENAFDLPSGHSLLAAGLLLALMVLPGFTALTADALTAVPREQREAALALGLGWPALLGRVLLPQAWPGVRNAVLLALGRALGETMAVMLVVGSLDRLPRPWWKLLQPAQTLTSRIGREIGEAASGSLLLSCGACLVAAPVALGLAVWLQRQPGSRQRPWLALLHLLQGIPPLVYGLCSLTLLVHGLYWGVSLLAGVLVLAAVVLPQLTLSSLEALARLPQEHTETARALGLSETAVVLRA